MSGNKLEFNTANDFQLESEKLGSRNVQMQRMKNLWRKLVNIGTDYFATPTRNHLTASHLHL